MGIIYCATNSINGKRYIGLTTQNLNVRKRNHKYKSKNNLDNSYFHNALNKYGFDAFEWTVLNETVDVKFLKRLEKIYISFYNTRDYDYGYNILSGGQCLSGENHPWWGKKHSVETLRKMSQKRKEYEITEESKQKMSKNHADVSGDKNPFFGKTHTNKSMLKMLKSKRGNGLFGFTGSSYHKRVDPWMRPWYSYITYHKYRTSLGYYNDPLSAQIVYDFVCNEIYNGEKD